MCSINVITFALLLNVRLLNGVPLTSIGALYCPDHGKKWQWKVVLMDRDYRYADDVVHKAEGGETNDVQYFKIGPTVFDNDEVFSTNLDLYFHIDHTCTNDGQWASISDRNTFDFIANPVDSDEKLIFKALNLKKDSHTIAYEKLFANYLGQECISIDCQIIYDRIVKGCNLLKFHQTECNDGLKSARSVYCNMNGGSKRKFCESYVTSASNKTTIIIVGIAVGVVVLIIAVVAFFSCRRKKKMQGMNQQSGMTGTATTTGSKTGTTRKSTTTGTFKKTKTTGTGTTGTKMY